MVLQYQHLEKWNGGADYLRTECLDYKKEKEMNQKVNENYFMDVKTKDAVGRFVSAWVKLLIATIAFSLLFAMGRNIDNSFKLLAVVELLICVYSEARSIVYGWSFGWEEWKSDIIDIPGLNPFRVIKVALYNKCVAAIGDYERIDLGSLRSICLTSMSSRRFKKYIKSMCDYCLFKQGYLVGDMLYLSKDAEIHHIETLANEAIYRPEAELTLRQYYMNKYSLAAEYAMLVRGYRLADNKHERQIAWNRMKKVAETAGEKYGPEFEHQVIQLSLHSEKDKAE